MTVTVNPNQGPSGTNVVISITGAPPGEAITLYVDVGQKWLIADANGNASTKETLSGRIKDVINIKAQAGDSPPFQTATTKFTITS